MIICYIHFGSRKTKHIVYKGCRIKAIKNYNHLVWNRKTMQDEDEYKYTASIYDFLLSRGLRSIRRNIRTILKHSGAKNVIDICCGTGEQLRMLSEENMLLTGVDNSPAMISNARKKSPSSIHYLETDATQLPIADNKYDAIVISFALHEKAAPHHKAIFREACRLVKHNGHIIIADYSTPTQSCSSFLIGKILIPIIERAAGLNHYHNYRDWMNQGALEGFLQKNSPGKITLVAPHSRECIKIFVISNSKDDPLSASIRGTNRHQQVERDT
ncbi:methylase involved in ubiquinone/menaquinone biosynthesis [Desulfocapsa sulfexigens DSM 10523]|uniref:Methylase involved in ubiquinone/menaquinone biosynthesis n=1 Tax=Desulfocapsa sulfexigens (strain DSM 10523 / SB164P1) TaxID=1167006 RepID=M1NGW3_DESSD|nr:class I SAM-dependent methyltransferase [Desulfocapsa sulfexigens]AGF78864.1 methylase involved in ubiquinone/menaquinone biosynthesis [Desulfocapsa sulfexigens DSM 10523]